MRRSAVPLSRLLSRYEVILVSPSARRPLRGRRRTSPAAL